MNKKIKAPKKDLVQGDEFYYRDQEMMRVEIESNANEKKDEKEQ